MGERVSSSLEPEVLSSVNESFNDGGSAIIDSARARVGRSSLVGGLVRRRGGHAGESFLQCFPS